MNPLRIATALLAGGCIAGAIFFLTTPEAPPVEVAEVEVPVLWSTDDIQAGAELTLDRFEVRLMPKGQLPDGYLDDRDAKNLRRDGRKWFAIAAVPRWTILTRRHFSETAPSLGMRAVSIPISDVANVVGNFISPGDDVDVMLTLTTGEDLDQFGGSLTRTLMPKVKLLAVGGSFTLPNAVNSRKEPFGRYITVEVKPEQVSEVRLATRQGILSLMLHRGDEETVACGRATRSQLMSTTGERDPGNFGVDEAKAVHERLDRLDKEWQAKFDAFRRWVAPGLILPQGGASSFLTIKMFRGTAATAVKIKMPSK